MSNDQWVHVGPDQPQRNAWPPTVQPVPPGYPTYAYGSAPTQGNRFGTGVVIGVVAGIAVLVLGIVALVVGVGLYWNSNAPHSLGDDPQADRLYAECDDGEMAACDRLYEDSAFGSELEEFGATCGGRLQTWATGPCTELSF